MTALRFTWPQQDLMRWLAILAMIAGHVAAAFLDPEAGFWWRVLGRIAWPTFALLIAYNLAVRQVSIDRYLWPLAIAAPIAQVPWMLLWGAQGANVLVTILLGIWVLMLSRAPFWWRWPAVAAVVAVAGPWVEFGAAGLLLITVLAWALRASTPWAWLLAGVAILAQNWPWPGAIAGVAVLPLIVWVSSLDVQLPRAPKWLLWVIYPAHLGLLVLVRMVV